MDYTELNKAIMLAGGMTDKITALTGIRHKIICVSNDHWVLITHKYEMGKWQDAPATEPMDINKLFDYVTAFINGLETMKRVLQGIKE